MLNTNNSNNNPIVTKDNMTDLVSNNPYANGDSSNTTPQPQSDNTGNQPTPSGDNTTSTPQPTPSYEVPGNDGKPIQLGAETTNIVTK